MVNTASPNSPEPGEPKLKIALVTEELSFGRGSGGIGGAFHELSLALAAHGHSVDVIHVPIDLAAPPPQKLVDYYADRNIDIIRPGLNNYIWSANSYERRSYAVFRSLNDLEQPYDFIHFHDYKGLGYFTLCAKQQQIAFANTVLVVQTHGPTRWALEANQHLFTHPDQLKIDFLERGSIARADLLVSPSNFLLEWFRQKEWKLPAPSKVHVIQNVCTHLKKFIPTGLSDGAPVREIIFFGRHEERKGFVQFCDAVDLLKDDLSRLNVTVSFLGGFGTLNGEDSAVYLAARSQSWRFPVSVLPDFDRIAATRYIAGNPASVVFIPSPQENSPYTLLEAIAIGKPVVTSNAGGAKELLAPESADLLTCDITPRALARKISQAITEGLPVAQPAVPPDATERQWLQFHQVFRPGQDQPPTLVNGSINGKARRSPAAIRLARRKPKVVAAITHYERPAKLFDAVLSLATQTYDPLEVVIVDDGSRSATTLAVLEKMQPLLEKLRIRLIRQENLYLGAARNRATLETDSDYLIFLDDDDIAFPYMVQTLVTAAEATGADIVNCLNLYMPEARRAESHPFPDRFHQKVSYVPMGGPLSLAPIENTLGAATALIRRKSLVALGGYTEEKDVGHEDFELYVRALQANLRIEICPLPLYLYEVDRPSMASRTSRMRNARRVVNAIDFQTNTAAWHDLITVDTGRCASEHIVNFAAYNRRLSPQAAMLERIAAAQSHTAEYASLLSEFASTIGAATFAHAMARLAQQRAAGTEPAGTEPVLLPGLMRSVVPKPEQRLDDMPMLLALADLALGRTAEAVAAFKLSLERSSDQLSELQLRFLRELMTRPRIHVDDLAPLLGTLGRARMTIDEFSLLAPALFQTALRTRNSDLAVHIVDRISATEDEAYLSANPDVQKAVADNGFSCGLAHFTRRGFDEGRDAFTVLRKLAEIAQTISGQELPLSSLRDFPSKYNLAHPSLEHLMPRQAATAGNGVAHPEILVSDAVPSHAIV